MAKIARIRAFFLRNPKIFTNFARYFKTIMWIYFTLLYIASLFNPKARALVKGQRSAWAALRARMSERTDADKWVWFHAASVGEFEQARPIIERLKKESPSRKVLLTFFSPSGYEMRKDYPLADLVCYLPFATRRNARRFVQLVQPEMAIFIKYEFWPAYLKRLKKAAVPTYIIAAIFREDQAFFRWWGGAYRRLLTCFTTLFVQDEASQLLLNKYGIRQTVVSGDTRFDRVMAVYGQRKDIPAVMRFVEPEITPLTVLQPERPKVLVAGSTWPEDERLLAEYCASHPEVKLVLVPHEIDDKHLHEIFQIFQGRFVRYSEANFQNITTNQTLLINTMGMLSSIYRYGQVAYVGGGFGEGIHNTLEAAVYGMPVVFGPNYGKFREAKNLIETGAARSVKNYEELEAALDDCFLHSEEMGRQAREYVQMELGSTDIVFETLFK